MAEIFKCPICESPIDVTNKKDGERLTCHVCFAQLALHRHKGKHYLACAMCKNAIFNPDNCENCESRLEKQRLLDEGRL